MDDATEVTTAELEELKVNALEKPMLFDRSLHHRVRVPAPELWTADHVSTRIVDAFRTLSKLPRPRGPKSPGNSWPEYAYSFADVTGWNDLLPSERAARDQDLNRVSDKPGSRDLAQMELAFEWLRWLRGKDDALSRVLALWAWASAANRSFRAICKERQWHRVTVLRKKDRAAEVIAAHLGKTRATVF